MKLFARGTTTQNPIGQFFKVNMHDSILQLDYGANIPDNEESKEVIYDQATIDLSQLFKPRNFFNIYPVNKNDGSEPSFAMSKIFDSKNKDRAREDILLQNDVIGIAGKTPLVVIYFHDAAEDVYIIINKEINVEGSNIAATIISDTTQLPQLVIKEIPALQNDMNVWSFRRDMIKQLDPNQSLAYIEAQLDAVTKALFLMFEQLPDVKEKVDREFPELPDFISELNNTSVFSVKTTTDCLAEITKTKAKIRQLQAAYYAVKKQNETP